MCTQKKEQEEVEAWDKAEKEAEEAAKASGSGFNARCDATLLATLWSCWSGRCAQQKSDTAQTLWRHVSTSIDGVVLSSR